MRNLTNIINQTPLKNSTFKFFATESHDETRDFYYTPYALVNWRFENNYLGYSVNYFIHDISHMLDIYLRGKKEQLLKTDFGWTLTGDEDKVPHSFGYTELRTAVIQNLLRQKILKRPNISFNEPNNKRYWRSRCGADFLPGKKNWEAYTGKLYQEAQDNGVKFYLNKWQEICEYVKENRD